MLLHIVATFVGDPSDGFNAISRASVSVSVVEDEPVSAESVAQYVLNEGFVLTHPPSTLPNSVTSPAGTVPAEPVVGVVVYAVPVARLTRLFAVRTARRSPNVLDELLENPTGVLVKPVVKFANCCSAVAAATVLSSLI
jgi:hypothetical protein